MKKNYVLDTNILLHDPRAIFRFEDNDVIIPIYVIEEIDQFKREGSERGRNARTIARLLDELREKGGSLATGVPLMGTSDGRLRVEQSRGKLRSHGARAVFPGPTLERRQQWFAAANTRRHRQHQPGLSSGQGRARGRHVCVDRKRLSDRIISRGFCRLWHDGRLL